MLGGVKSGDFFVELSKCDGRLNVLFAVGEAAGVGLCDMRAVWRNVTWDCGGARVVGGSGWFNVDGGKVDEVLVDRYC